MIQLHSGEFMECEVNKEVFEQIRRFKGQSYISENSEIKVLNIDGITVRPRIKNIYLKTGPKVPFPCERAELEDLPV